MGIIKQACSVAFLSVLLAPIAFLFWKMEVNLNHFSVEDKGWKELQSSVQQRKIATNGIELLVNEAGPTKDAKGLIILLHGFPETGLSTWKYQIPFLAKQGYKVLAPDQRGYNTSWKSLDYEACNYVKSAEDVADLIKQSGFKKAHIVGHDWGTLVAWDLAAQHPELVDKLIVMDVPHPRTYSLSNGYIFQAPSQILRMWYTIFLQFNEIAEWRFRKDDFAWPISFMISTSNPGSYSVADIERLKEAWRQPNAVEAMIGWYRYAIRNMIFNLGFINNRYSKPIAAPTKIIFGDNDLYTDPKLGELSTHPSMCTNCSFLLLHGSHWITRDQPDRINQEILSFISS